MVERVLLLSSEIRRIASEHGAHSIRLFGSAARGEAGPLSDLDFAVETEAGTTLFDLARLRAALVELLDVDVDVAPLNGFDPEQRERLDTEAIRL